ncbi:MAG TPA: hypothetical protein VKP66_01460, partial [Steroidobacteraceae bacterium]|nr:hypothetical protein [Steroidobacteraceae bacterium]
MSVSAQAGTYEVRVDIGTFGSAATPVQIAATVHVPAWHPGMTRATVIFAVPGGGYSRGYFDMQFPRHAGYSQARYHRDHGLLFVACDPIGVGASSQPDPASID